MKIVPMSVTLIDSMGSDLSVVNAARVSFHKESEWELKEEERCRCEAWNEDECACGNYYPPKYLSEKDQKLISYLAKHNHWTPFGHAFLSFRIKAPIFVARQLVKHQVGLVWNEVSRRYVDEEPEFWFPDVWRGKPVNAKQGSSDVVVTKIQGSAGYSPVDWAKQACSGALCVYKDMIDSGVAPEQARMVLPQNTMTEWVWSGSLAAFARVCKLRLDPHAQKETQDVAKLINGQVPVEFESSWEALLGSVVSSYPVEDQTGKKLLG